MLNMASGHNIFKLEFHINQSFKTFKMRSYESPSSSSSSSSPIYISTSWCLCHLYTCISFVCVQVYIIFVIEGLFLVRFICILVHVKLKKSYLRKINVIITIVIITIVIITIVIITIVIITIVIIIIIQVYTVKNGFKNLASVIESTFTWISSLVSCHCLYCFITGRKTWMTGI